MKGVPRAYTISSNDQLLAASDYKNLIIAYRNGAAVRVSADVAQVVDSAENIKLGGVVRPETCNYSGQCSAAVPA